MNQLETLLNSLIKMGWKPWGKDVDKITIPPKEEFNEDRCLFIDIKFSNGFGTYRSRRELVSRESQLWQFVCSHLLIGLNKNDRSKNSDIGEDGYLTADQYYEALNHQYRLLESALVPEEELGKFLLDNIAIRGK